MMMIELFCLKLFPLPDGVVASNTEPFRIWFQSLPITALLLILAMIMIGAFLGGCVSSVICRTRPLLYSGIVGAFVLALYFFNHLTAPYPAWLTIAALVGVPLASFLAKKLTSDKGK
jgi:hypothetical protein